MDIEQIKLTYSKMDTYQLKKLVNEIAGIREEIIPVLKDELERRNEYSLITKINEFENKKEAKVKFQDKIDIDQYVNERIATGEAMESIVNDLKNKGIDLLSLALDEALKKEIITDEVFEMKSSSYINSERKKAIKEKYNLNEKEFTSIESRIKLKSKNNRIIGFLSILVGVIYLIGGLYVGRFYFLSIGFIIAGIGKIIIGIKQRKK